MIDFPSSPTTGQTYTDGKSTWVWDGVKWTSTSSATGLYLPLTGGVMQGDITLARDPAQALHPATKQYVDVLPRASGANRIINGDMRIDQRNNGAANTVSGYTIDRWTMGTGAQTGKLRYQQSPAAGALAPFGFGYSLTITSITAFTPAATDPFRLLQLIEADMVTDFAMGTSGAQPSTLSFWVASTLTGMFSGAISSPVAPRSFVFTYNIAAANTWTKVVVPVPGDTGGTWTNFGNTYGMGVMFDLGSGANFQTGTLRTWIDGDFRAAPGSVKLVSTNGAVLNFTGVKLELGTVATPFRSKNPQESLADCQRYYQIGQVYQSASGQVAGNSFNAGTMMPVAMRASSIVPTILTNNSSNWTQGTLNYNPQGTLVAIGTATAAGVVTINIILAVNAEL